MSCTADVNIAAASSAGRKAADNLPPHVLRLPEREREVATIIYLNGACTAKDVEALLSVRVSNGAVRSMLMRLVRKGLLERRWGKRGPNQHHIYLPAISPTALKERALCDLAEKYFDGSLLSTAMAALHLIGKEVDDVSVPRRQSLTRVPFELAADRLQASHGSLRK